MIKEVAIRQDILLDNLSTTFCIFCTCSSFQRILCWDINCCKGKLT